MPPTKDTQHTSKSAFWFFLFRFHLKKKRIRQVYFDKIKQLLTFKSFLLALKIGYRSMHVRIFAKQLLSLLGSSERLWRLNFLAIFLFWLFQIQTYFS